MKKLFAVILSLIFVLSLASCNNAVMPKVPDEKSLKRICELAVLKCSYHNVATFEKPAPSFFDKNKKKRFWIEYSGSAEMGINAEDLKIQCEGSDIKVFVPKIEVLSFINDDEYTPYIDPRSAKIEADDEKQALTVAQEELKGDMEKDESLVLQSRARAETLLKDYIMKINEAVGAECNITFEDLPEEEKNKKEEISEAVSEAVSEIIPRE